MQNGKASGQSLRIALMIAQDAYEDNPKMEGTSGPHARDIALIIAMQVKQSIGPWLSSEGFPRHGKER